MNRRFALTSAFAAAGIAAFAACTPMISTELDIVTFAATDGNFNTFVAALAAADLDETLAGPGPFTVFMPSDEAFATLPSGRLDDLLLPENKDQLIALLTYHVVPAAVSLEQLVDQRQSLATMNGASLQIDGNDGVKVGNATITMADISAANGVIHVIDSVLLP